MAEQVTPAILRMPEEYRNRAKRLYTDITAGRRDINTLTPEEADLLDRWIVYTVTPDIREKLKTEGIQLLTPEEYDKKFPPPWEKPNFWQAPGGDIGGFIRGLARGAVRGLTFDIVQPGKEGTTKAERVGEFVGEQLGATPWFFPIGGGLLSLPFRLARAPALPVFRAAARLAESIPAAAKLSSAVARRLPGAGAIAQTMAPAVTYSIVREAGQAAKEGKSPFDLNWANVAEQTLLGLGITTVLIPRTIAGRLARVTADRLRQHADAAAKAGVQEPLHDAVIRVSDELYSLINRLKMGAPVTPAEIQKVTGLTHGELELFYPNLRGLADDLERWVERGVKAVPRQLFPIPGRRPSYAKQVGQVYREVPAARQRATQAAVQQTAPTPPTPLTPAPSPPAQPVGQSSITVQQTPTQPRAAIQEEPYRTLLEQLSKLVETRETQRKQQVQNLVQQLQATVKEPSTPQKAPTPQQVSRTAVPAKPAPEPVTPPSKKEATLAQARPKPKAVETIEGTVDARIQTLEPGKIHGPTIGYVQRGKDESGIEATKRALVAGLTKLRDNYGIRVGTTVRVLNIVPAEARKGAQQRAVYPVEGIIRKITVMPNNKPIVRAEVEVPGWNRPLLVALLGISERNRVVINSRVLNIRESAEAVKPAMEALGAILTGGKRVRPIMRIRDVVIYRSPDATIKPPGALKEYKVGDFLDFDEVRVNPNDGKLQPGNRYTGRILGFVVPATGETWKKKPRVMHAAIVQVEDKQYVVRLDNQYGIALDEPAITIKPEVTIQTAPPTNKPAQQRPTRKKPSQQPVQPTQTPPAVEEKPAPLPNVGDIVQFTVGGQSLQGYLAQPIAGTEFGIVVVPGTRQRYRVNLITNQGEPVKVQQKGS